MKGLGKTVEAIALLLLNRHPLATAREVVKPEERVPQRSRSQGTVTVPTIDLTQMLDVYDDKALLTWWRQEQEAFRDAVKRDEEAQMDVSEVAVSFMAEIHLAD